jgi:polyisoprenoid-binding protein YceI
VRPSRTLVVALGWSAAVPLAAGAQSTPRVQSAVLQSAVLSFTGHATVGSFVGTTSNASGAVTGDLSGARGWVEATVATLVTHNDHRDRDLRASMEVSKYPTMRFDLDRTTIAASRPAHGDTVAVLLHGTLTIHGVARTVELPATVVRRSDAIHVTLEFPLDLEEYRIDGLTKAFGLLRMNRMIEVRADLVFVADPVPQS